MDYEKIGANLKAIIKARGYTHKKVSEMIGISVPTIQRHLSTGKMDMGMLMQYTEVLGCSVEDIVSDALDPTKYTLEDNLCKKWPWNVAAAVWHTTSQDKLYAVYIPGLLESINRLSDRETNILECLYKHGMNNEKTGAAYNVTRERVRQIEAKALRKLAHPQNQKMWRMDDRLMERAFSIMEEASAIKKAAIIALEKNDSALSALETIYKIARNAMASKPPKKEEEDEFSERKIEELEFSVRTYNCLKRAGINTIGDLLEMPSERLATIRNLGKKSLNEIEVKLREIN